MFFYGFAAVFSKLIPLRVAHGHKTAKLSAEQCFRVASVRGRAAAGQIVRYCGGKSFRSQQSERSRVAAKQYRDSRRHCLKRGAGGSDKQLRRRGYLIGTDRSAGAEYSLAPDHTVCLGGSLADRFGAFRFSLIAQPLGTALFVLSTVQPLLAIPATLLFNTTMAITAHAVYRSAPHRSGTMFGLTTLALYLGVLPRLLSAPNPLFTWWGLALIGLGSTGLLLLGLQLARREGKRLAC